MPSLIPGGRDPQRRTLDAPGTGLTPLPGQGYRLNPNGPLPQTPRPPGTQPPNAPGATRPPTPPPAQPLNITAQDDPRLTALNDRYGKYLDSYEKGVGGAMDLAAQRFRDAREGQRAAMREGAAFSGGPGDLSGFDQATLRGEQAAIADVAAQREAAMGENLRGGLPLASAPGEANRAERGFGLQTWMAQQQQQQQAWENQRSQSTDAFQQFLALLQANRTSPTGGVGLPGSAPVAPTGGFTIPGRSAPIAGSIGGNTSVRQPMRTGFGGR